MNESSPSGQRLILVVDDEPAMLELAGHFLSDQGCVVTTAENGVEGLRHFASKPFDLVITDRTMPRMTGDELARAIKLRSPGTPIILATSQLRETEDGNRFDAVLAKPFTKEQLLAAMTEVLPSEASKDGPG